MMDTAEDISLAAVLDRSAPWPLLFFVVVTGFVAMVRSHHSMSTDHTLDAEYEILKRN
jgi:hypothetical protein